MRGFGPRSVAGVSLVVSLTLAACTLQGQQGCSPDQAIPAAFVDTALLFPDEPDRVVVCLDDECSSLGFGGGPNSTVTEVRADGDRIQRTIVVRTLDGVVLAGPTLVELRVVEEGCPGEALQGSFFVSQEGKIKPAP